MHVMNRSFIICALPFTLLIGPFALAQAQEAHAHQKHGEMGAQMMPECQAMMTAREAMMSEIRSTDAKLDELVAAMNAAKGEAKVEALARVVTEMAEHRKNAMGKMMAMQPEMMQHMMEHMRQGMMEGNEKAMECPMMKGTMESPKKDPAPIR
jgi:hypothetical protein